MHQTTVRFSTELWHMLEAEAERTGVSVAHFVRESALARLAFAAGQRSMGEDGSLDWADPRVERAHPASVEGARQVGEASGVSAQARLAAARSAQLRERTRATLNSASPQR
jgi:hypothetical protein